MPKRLIPSVEGYAQPDESGKLFAPAAARNVAALTEVVARLAPASGSALEIASGTGQHVCSYAVALPDLRWQPTEIDPVRRTSIDARAAEAGLANIAPARALDATAPGWSTEVAPQDLILLANLLHLVSREEAQTLINEAALALAPGGIFLVYGPFSRSGALTSEGDKAFDASIRAQDAQAGYKDDGEVIGMMEAAGLTWVETVEMPANNLVLAARRD